MEPQSSRLISNLKTFFNKYDLTINEKNHAYIEALTHNSYANEHHLLYNYQRLEFLGDAILTKEISLFLFIQYPNKKEGEITNLRSKLVRESTLAQLIKKLGLQSLILLGKGEIKTKGFEKDGILADIYESILAALYLDLGESAVRSFINKTLITMFSNSSFFNHVRDYKTELQEFLQSGVSRNLIYKLVSETAPLEGNKILYTIVAEIDGVRYGEGKGYSHKDAEQEAASDVLKKLAKK